MRATNLKILSAHLGSTLVLFDIKHTGSKVEERGIVEFSAQAITKRGLWDRLDTVINPGESISWNPIAKGKLRFHWDEVEDAPLWIEKASDFVLSKQNQVWIGFNAKADATIIRQEHLRLGLPAGLPHSNIIKG